MKALIAFVSHERLDYTKKSLRSLKETLTIDHKIVVYDNASSEEVRDWLGEARAEGLCDAVIFSGTNDYPGAAANAAWELGLSDHMPDADLLVRVDNDMEFLPGWDTEMVKAFESHTLLGQLGLMNQSQAFPGEENRVVPHTVDGYTINRFWTNVGGTMAMRREVYDLGIKYDETPWQAASPEQPTPQEDVKLSLAIAEAGFYFGNLIPHLVIELSYGNTDTYYEYYCRTFTQRGHSAPPRTRNGEVVGEDGAPVSGSHTLAQDHI